jgi:hypothetical protein
VGDERAAVSAGVGLTAIGAVCSNRAESGVCHAYMYTPVVSSGLEPAPAASQWARRPMPCACTPGSAWPPTRVLMPMTWPWRFVSGPPELPGLIGTSVWIASNRVGP